MSKELEYDLLRSFQKFKDTAKMEIIGAVKRGMRKAAKEIQERTVENARGGIKTFNNHAPGQYKNQWGKYEKESILDAPRIGKIQDRYDEDNIYLKVHVMGTGRSESKTFRFRFLEKGTTDRYAKTLNGKALQKPRYLGSIQPRRYFAKAVNSIDIQPIYLKEIQKTIEKLNETA